MTYGYELLHLVLICQHVSLKRRRIVTLPLVHTVDRSRHALEPGARASNRHLSDLKGVFVDEAARVSRVADGDPLVYTVEGVEHPGAPGALSYGLGVISPGHVGSEYFMTKGHAHTHRDAAEVYIGMQGSGLMVLQDLRDGRCWTLPLERDAIVVVPGHTAHRTVNVGAEPLCYLGIYPSDAGHDYEVIAASNFKLVVRAGPDGPQVVERSALRLTSAEPTTLPQEDR